MKVSVLISNYNYARYLAEAIESALRQDYDDLEVIVIDDGSVDESRSVIEQCAHQNFGRVFPLFQENAGQAAAINLGFTRCRGDIIAMLDADDLWDRGKIAAIVSAFEANPNATMVQHRMRDATCDETPSKVVQKSPSLPANLAPLLFRTGGAWMFSPTSALSFRREALDQILPIPAQTWKLCADGALAYAAALLGEVVNLDEALGTYRDHGANNHLRAAQDLGRVTDELKMTNEYTNSFLARVGRKERIELRHNLHYRRNRFYSNGGSFSEALGICRLILTWPLYSIPKKLVLVVRFWIKAATLLPKKRLSPATL